MTTGFSLQRFRFHLEPKAPLRMPAYNKGNMIRGGFGSTFRRLVCHANCREPETCELRNVCPYTAVFQPFIPEDSEKISRNRDIPRPFVIKPPLETKRSCSCKKEIRRMIEREQMPPPTPVRNRCTDCEYRNYCGDIF